MRSETTAILTENGQLNLNQTQRKPYHAGRSGSLDKFVEQLNPRLEATQVEQIKIITTDSASRAVTDRIYNLITV